MDVRLEEESMATTRFTRPLQTVSEVVSEIIRMICCDNLIMFSYL